MSRRYYERKAASSGFGMVVDLFRFGVIAIIAIAVLGVAVLFALTGYVVSLRSPERGAGIRRTGGQLVNGLSRLL